MTLEDVKAQVEALMRVLEEGKNIIMMNVICEGNKADIMTVGDAGDLLTAVAIGLGRYMADQGGSEEGVEAFCKLTASTAKKRMKTAGKVN